MVKVGVGPMGSETETVTAIGEAEKYGCSIGVRGVVGSLDMGRKAIHEALTRLVNETADNANELDLNALEGRGRLMIDLIRIYKRLGVPSEPRKVE